MTGILLSIVVVSTSAYISLQRIIKQVRHHQQIHIPTKSPDTLLTAAETTSTSPTESIQSLPYIPSGETSLTQVLAIYKQIALQKGYYAVIIDSLNHAEGTNLILWLNPSNIAEWETHLDLQPISDLPDPAENLTLYDQNLNFVIETIQDDEFIRLSLFTMHYTITNLNIKSTRQSSSGESHANNQIQTKDLTKIHHKLGKEHTEWHLSEKIPRVIPPQQAQNSSDLSEQETTDAT